MKLLVEDELHVVGTVRALVFDGDIDPGRITAVLDDSGTPEWKRIVSVGQWRNLVTNIGRQQMTKLIVAETTLTARYMALSTSVIVAGFADVALTNEFIRVGLSVAQSFNTYYQRYSAYFSTVSFASTSIFAEGLFDTATTGGFMWADASISLSKTALQSAVVEHRIQATTG